MAAPEAGGDLAEAQARKIERLLDRTGSARAPGCSRSAPAGASSRSAPPVAAPSSHSITLSQRAEGAGRAADRGGRARRPGDRRAARLPRTVAARRAYDAVLSVEMIEAVGYDFWTDYFQILDQRARARRPGRPPGDHDAPRPDAGDPQHLHLDQQVHLPRRLPALGRGDRPDHPRPHDAADRRPPVVRVALRRDAAAVGRARSWPSATP